MHQRKSHPKYKQTHLIPTVTPGMEVGAKVDLQAPMAKVLNADLQVKREFLQIQAKAVGLHEVPTDIDMDVVGDGRGAGIEVAYITLQNTALTLIWQTCLFTSRHSLNTHILELSPGL